ncbi:MAG: hypothetical protein BMS9Abin06_0644 [Gammaproteobacteria bacterium]|nr:MAG: hypothetical protein BMS9Abin06_0644 [Gammaproteobacteria bacterium]
MNQEKTIEKLVLVCLDTAQAMLEKYGMVIPFGIRAINDGEDLKMNCPGDKKPKANFNKQIEMVVDELKAFVKDEFSYVIAIVTELESGDEKAIGLQVETDLSSVLCVYPFRKENEQWIIDNPIQTDQLLPSVRSPATDNAPN